MNTGENSREMLAGGKNANALYFIGIGGIGMSALARYFHTQGWQVSGYDRTVTALTKDLETEGVAIHYEENPDIIPKNVQWVIYTPAIPADHKELVFYKQHGYNVIKRSDALQIITESSFNICVAGTHGKTTITTMIAHLLRDSDYGCNAFLGGISVNYGTNFWSSERNVCVIEADEYDRSFLKLSPDIAVISSMDADHLDIYGDVKSIEQAFIDFSARLKPGGLLISKWGLKRTTDFKSERHITYSLRNEAADVYSVNISMQNGSYEFDVIRQGNRLNGVVLNMGGLHNIENVLAAIAVADSLGIPEDKIKSAVASFRGVKRRFQYIVKNDSHVFIDDYAHHPEELRALLIGARGLFPEKKLSIIFQPHLYSRTRDFAKEFAAVLDIADEVILLPVYPARELPLEGVTSEIIAVKMNCEQKRIMDKVSVLSWLKSDFKNRKNTVLITVGAGDIDTLIEPIKQELI